MDRGSYFLSVEDVDKLWELQLTGVVYWRLSLQGLSEVAVPGLPGWSVVTPIGMGRMGRPSPWAHPFTDEIHLCEREIFLRYRGLDSVEPEPGTTASSALALLRFLSRQQTIPRRCVSAALGKPEPYGELPLEWTQPQALGLSTRDYFIQCAVTDAHIDSLKKLPRDFSVPIHVDVLLDALEAHVDHDYRKSLLYSAIAMEAFAQACLDAAYSRVLAQRCAEHRVRGIEIAGGKEVLKDSVYEALSMGDNFSRLLHERPLYLLGRSLLIDEPDNYRQALTLYGTRNKIAHRGMSPEGEKYLPLSAEGARQGLRIAIDVFRWLGDPGPYVPWDKLVSFPAN